MHGLRGVWCIFLALWLVYPCYAEITDVEVAAVDSSSALSGFVTQDIILSTDTQLIGAAMYMRLLSGRFYNDRLGDDYGTPPQLTVDAFPSLEFDTYFDGPSDGPLVFPTGPIVDEKQMFAVWGALGSRQSGEIRVARITLADDTNGALGALRLVTNLSPSTEPEGGFFLDAHNGELQLTPAVADAYTSGQHVLSGNNAITSISNPGTFVQVPESTLVMHDLSEVDFDIIRIENEAVVEFDGGLLFAPGTATNFDIDSKAELIVKDGYLATTNVNLTGGSRFEVAGGTLSMATQPTDFGIHAVDSEVLISGGTIRTGMISSQDLLTITGGEIDTVRSIQVLGGVGLISGGLLDIGESLLVGESELYLSGGEITLGGRLQVTDGTVYVAGGNFNFPSGPLIESNGTLSGILADGNPFAFRYELRGEGRIVLNPEPSSFCLSWVAWAVAFGLRRRRGSSGNSLGGSNAC